ncbi:MAG: T9SS type A sorting domain-containing protein, partial [Taibaiella sp.]|nr:T9SS type A sorting domain-containing protein [Taibaiella sp.]
ATTTLGVELSGSHTPPPGTTVTVNATVTGADSAYSIKWYNHGALFTTTTAPVTTYTKAAGIDTITATVLSASQSCTDTALSALHIVYPDATAVGSVVAIAAPLQLYPNPVENTLYISCAATVTSVLITNTLGQQVYSGSTTTADVRGLVAGVYFVRVNGVVGGRFLKK